MWNQVGSECLLLRAVDTDTELNASPAVLLIRTYAFFNRNKIVLTGLLCALGGMIAYQLYVDTSQMIGKRPFNLTFEGSALSCLCLCISVLPFLTPPFVCIRHSFEVSPGLIFY